MSSDPQAADANKNFGAKEFAQVLLKLKAEKAKKEEEERQKAEAAAQAQKQEGAAFGAKEFA